MLLALVALGVTIWLTSYRPAVTDWMATKLSSGGKAQNPRRFDVVYLGALWIAFGLVVAALVPPHYTRTLRVLRNWRYWLACIVLVIAGGYIPWKLATWVPGAKDARSSGGEHGRAVCDRLPDQRCGTACVCVYCAAAGSPARTHSSNLARPC